MKADEGYADRVLHEALTAAMGGLDPERVEAAITAAVDAIAKQMQALEAKNYGEMPVAELARAVAHTTKAGDVLYRLAEFARGRPDSRPDNGPLRSHDVLKLLTDEQLALVQRWLEAAPPAVEAEREGRRP